MWDRFPKPKARRGFPYVFFLQKTEYIFYEFHLSSWLKYTAKLNLFKGTDRITSMKRERIQDQVEHDRRIELEYGIPLETIPYKKIWEKIDLVGYSEEISNEAADLVEIETQKGKPGAFVIRRIIDDEGTGNVEVWGWSD